MKRLALATLLIFSLPAQSYACTVCFGDPNDPSSKAVTAGVLLLMGVIGSVLFGIASIGFVWHRRAKRLAELTEKFI